MPTAPFIAPVGDRSGGLLQVLPYPDYPAPITLFDITNEMNAIAALATALVYPSGYTISPSALTTRIGGFGAAQFSATVWLSTFWLMTGLNAEAEIELPLKIGTYTVKMLWTRGSSSGDLTLKLDAANVGTVIGYNASNLNAESTWTITVLTSGLHTLNFKVNAKQGASSGFNIAVSQFTIQKN